MRGRDSSEKQSWRWSGIAIYLPLEEQKAPVAIGKGHGKRRPV